MGRRPTTRLQVSGHRFLVRRMTHALVRADVRMLDDPLRAQDLSLLAGAVLTAIAVLAGVALAVLRPAGVVDAPIVLDRASGALYVRIGDTLHPVHNLASARLIVGASDPQPVTAAAIAEAKRGPLVGIPGAPGVIAPALGAEDAGWTVCDSADSTTVVAGSRDDLGREGAVLATVRGESGAAVYLFYDGRRAAVDLRDRAVVRSLQLEGVAPQAVSRSLLGIVPEAPPIAAPHIPRAGAPGPSALGRVAVGTVVQVAGSSYVVLSEGVQRVGALTADLIRFSVPQPVQTPGIAADRLSGVPVVGSLPVATFPDRVHVTAPPVVCARWLPNEHGATVAVTVADSLGTPPAVALAQADGDGPNIDAVAMPGGRSAYVRSTNVWGGSGAGAARYLVDDRGVVFGVRDDQAAQRLGLAGAAVPTPWPLLAQLPHGPELSVQAASVARDGAAPPGG